MNEIPEHWYSMKEITTHLRGSRDTVLSWIEKYGMPDTRIGHLWKFKINDIDAWMEARGNE